jgi:hypothetical protein
MAESQAAQIARLEERLAQVQRAEAEHEARIVELEKHDAEYKRIIGLSRFGVVIVLGVGAFLAWLPGWIGEIKRLFFTR